MTKSAMIRTRIMPDLKIEGEKILKKLGLTTTEAVILFFSQIKLQGGLPFEVKIPNKTTLKAMKEAEEGKGLQGYKSLEDFFKKMGV